ncbi:GIY-YIG nuclease family protein [Candidatus Parcubacteria bacterium]|nr:GIY-YIG nuclease family protein [Candidatus Parcubacteria bacterium]
MLYYKCYYFKKKICFTYIFLECQQDKSWYIGYTSDLKRRINDHQNGYGCRTTFLKNNWKLIYCQKSDSCCRRSINHK